MKMKLLTITFEPLDAFFVKTQKELRNAAKGGKKSIQRKDNLVWSSVEAYQQFMSDQKYAILAAVHKFAPDSIYQLAKILGRAQQNVARDCELLEQHGFLRFEQSEKGRKVKKPQLSFPYNAILICLPQLSYKVEFSSKAA
jgi:predicted transcriptional regulator